MPQTGSLYPHNEPINKRDKVLYVDIIINGPAAPRQIGCAFIHTVYHWYFSIVIFMEFRSDIISEN